MSGSGSGSGVSKSNITNLGTEYHRANKRQAAEFFDVNVKTIDAWIYRGAPVVARGGLGKPWELNILDICKWYFEQGRAMEPAIPPDLMEPRDRKAWYESEVKRRELQDRDSRLVRASEVGDCLQPALEIIFQHCREIPQKLAADEITASTAPHVAADIEEALDAMTAKLGPLSLGIEALAE